MEKEVNINLILGMVFCEVYKIEDSEIVFNTQDGDSFRMYHYQDCCEDVSIEDIEGDLSDLIGSPILQAEEVINSTDEMSIDSLYEKYPIINDFGSRVNEKGEYMPDSATWTFYKLATIKGYVTIRWYGVSNGYYSESVCFVKCN